MPTLSLTWLLLPSLPPSPSILFLSLTFSLSLWGHIYLEPWTSNNKSAYCTVATSETLQKGTVQLFQLTASTTSTTRYGSEWAFRWFQSPASLGPVFEATLTDAMWNIDELFSLSPAMVLGVVCYTVIDNGNYISLNPFPWIILGEKAIRNILHEIWKAKVKSQSYFLCWKFTAWYQPFLKLTYLFDADLIGTHTTTPPTPTWSYFNRFNCWVSYAFIPMTKNTIFRQWLTSLKLEACRLGSSSSCWLRVLLPGTKTTASQTVKLASTIA